MKKKLFFAGLILLFAACSKESENMVNNAQMEETTAPVRVHVRDFAVEMGDFSGFTRAAQDVADYNNVKAITLAFYKGNTEVYKHEQLRGALEQGETFGEFSTTLPLGSYTMVVIARGHNVGDVFTLTSPTEAAYTGALSRETFAYTQAVNITNGDAVELSATLNRIMAMLGTTSTDLRTAEATSLRMTFSAGGKSFNPTTGFATVNTGFTATVPITTNVGSVTQLGTYVFLTADEQTMDVTIETLDGEGNTIFSKTIHNVPFKRNRLTNLIGAMYSNDAISANSFKLNTSWLTNYEANF
jgi:hypothetical protein